MKYFKLFFAIMLVTIQGLNSYAQSVDDIVEEVTASIELDEAQSKALATQLGKYAISLQFIFDRYEEAEPDPQAMLTDIKNSREEYHKALKNDIGKEKFKAYEGFVDQIQLEILGEAAYFRLLDLQEPLKMTDDQVMQMKQIMAKAMKGMMETLMKYVDAKMNVRTKLKVGNSIKSIKKTMEKERAQVLTGEQIKKWDEIREAAKAEKDAKKEAASEN